MLTDADGSAGKQLKLASEQLEVQKKTKQKGAAGCTITSPFADLPADGATDDSQNKAAAFEVDSEFLGDAPAESAAHTAGSIYFSQMQGAYKFKMENS